MAATPHPAATGAAYRVLGRGGSAVDAAIAANAALAVAYPHMAGIGGDGFLLIHDPEGSVRAINASGPAASTATREYYRDDGHDSIPERGSAAALTVPGAVDGWRLAHESYGRLDWESLFADAIDGAREGIPVTDNLAAWIRRDRDVLAADGDAAATFLRDGKVPKPGSPLRQPDLADTLERIAVEGARAGFYNGAAAGAFCDALASSADGPGSPLTPEDFATYEAEWVAPLSTSYRGHTLYELPPNTQGFAALELANLLERFDPTAWGDDTADFYHHLTEATKLAFADRDAWLTDPDHVDPPFETLLSDAYAESRAELIEPTRTLPTEVDPGVAPDDDTDPVHPGGDTTYFTVVDRDGLVVSAIQSIYFDFGAGVVAGDTGIVPQNRGAFFSLDPDHVNTLEPGKKSFHTLIPALLTTDDEPLLSFGTMGGEGQPQTQAAMIARIVDFGYDAQRAVEAPRWLYGRTWGEESRSLSVEGRVPDRVIQELEARGHDVRVTTDFDATMGHAAAIRFTDHGTLEGGVDPRGDGTIAGR